LKYLLIKDLFNYTYYCYIQFLNYNCYNFLKSIMKFIIINRNFIIKVIFIMLILILNLFIIKIINIVVILVIIKVILQLIIINLNLQHFCSNLTMIALLNVNQYSVIKEFIIKINLNFKYYCFEIFMHINSTILAILDFIFVIN